MRTEDAANIPAHLFLMTAPQNPHVIAVMAPQDALYCLYDLERSAEHDDSVLWATCGELLIRLWPTVCGGADASEEQACAGSLSPPLPFHPACGLRQALRLAGS